MRLWPSDVATEQVDMANRLMGRLECWIDVDVQDGKQPDLAIPVAADRNAWQPRKGMNMFTDAGHARQMTPTPAVKLRIVDRDVAGRASEFHPAGERAVPAQCPATPELSGGPR